MKNTAYFLKKSIPYDEKSIEEFLEECETAIRRLVQNREDAFKISFAVQELTINSLEHGYRKNGGSVSVALSRRPNVFCLEVTDEGTGMGAATPDLENEISSLEEAHERGWGLQVIHRLFGTMEITAIHPHGTRVSLTLPRS